MRAAFAFAALLALGTLPATATAAPGLPGPFAGFVVEGQTNAHFFVSQPQGMQCILPVTWVVTLRYTPVTDVLGLEANGIDATGSQGFAQVSLEGACSTSFLILVSGVDVALIASYVVEIHSTNAPPA